MVGYRFRFSVDASTKRCAKDSGPMSGSGEVGSGEGRFVAPNMSPIGCPCATAAAAAVTAAAAAAVAADAGGAGGGAVIRVGHVWGRCVEVEGWPGGRAAASDGMSSVVPSQLSAASGRIHQVFGVCGFAEGCLE